MGTEEWDTWTAGDDDVSLNEARRRVAWAMKVPRAEWTPGQVRWLTEHWTLFRPELEQCVRLKEELMELERQARPWWWLVLYELGGGFAWWTRDATLPARALLAFAGLMAAAFAYGWT